MNDIKKKKHTVACVFMALAVVGAIPLGINHSLRDLREDAASSYYYDQGGYGIFEGIEKRCADASDLVTLARRYEEEYPELGALIDELDYRVQTANFVYNDDDTFTTAVRANRNLDAPAQDLADALNGIGLQEKDQKYPAALLANMRAEQDKINRSSYNDEARAFNQKLERMRPIAMLSPMAVFDDTDPGAAESAEVFEDTGIPQAQRALDPDELAEEAEEYAERVASKAEEYADELSNQAEDWADAFSDRVERWAENYAESVTDRAAEAFRG